MRLQVLILGLACLTAAAQPVPPVKPLDKKTTAKNTNGKPGKPDGQPANDQAQNPPVVPNTGANPPAAPAPNHYYCGSIAADNVDPSTLQLENAFPTPSQAQCDPKGEQPGRLSIPVQKQALKDSIKNWKPGDKVIAGVSGPKDKEELQDLRSQTAGASRSKRIWVAVPAAIILLVFTSLVSRNLRGLLFIGQDNRYSNSKTQVSLWFGLVIVSYITAFVLRWCYTGFLGGINIPTNLLMISGLSGLTFAGAKGITAAKDSAAKTKNEANAAATAAANTASDHAAVAAATADAANRAVTDNASLAHATAVTNAAAVAKHTAAAAAAAPGVNAPQVERKQPAAQPSFPGDLLRDDNGNFDFGDYQMLVITLIAIASYGLIVFKFLGVLEQRASITLPDVDTTILALFGVGHGAYLTKKAVTGANQ